MAQIEGLRIQNYKALKDITLGKLWYTHNEKSLTKLTALIGKNGTGKSSVFDALGFISDCLNIKFPKIGTNRTSSRPSVGATRPFLEMRQTWISGLVFAGVLHFS